MPASRLHGSNNLTWRSCFDPSFPEIISAAMPIASAISSFVFVPMALAAVAAVERDPNAFIVSGAPRFNSPTPAPTS